MSADSHQARRVSKLALLLCAAGIAAAGHAASYRVHPLPTASPDHGPRVLLVDPHDAVASPWAWHDTNGIPGAEHTILRGNNVWVFLDQNNDGVPDGPGPDGGAGLVFDHAAAPGVVPALNYADALATNAFYLGNMIHDILWHHGFREQDGNFQENNYGNGGLGGDALRIEIFKGNGLNNVTTVTAADGSPSSIRLYPWNVTNPTREPSFDAAVVGWAYMQVAQRRLNGLACTGNTENPVFGHGDFFGTLITNDFASTTPATRRGMATWLLGQPVTGTGIRAHPYSVDMAVNPLTYADSATIGGGPGGIGAIYASALWDLAWRLVQLQGASGNMVSGNGGENTVLRLLIQALKLQTCNAGLVDARDALLLADQQLFAGANQCEIWGVFARRGLGASASQGLTSSVMDNVAAFDVPAACGTLFANGFQTTPPQPVWVQFCAAGGPITIPPSGPASPYPVPIVVSGIPAPVAGIRVRMQGVSHTFMDDIDALLVGPAGHNLVVQSDVGGATGTSGISYVLDDQAATLMPDAGLLISGSYRPTNATAGDLFDPPAPAGPHGNPAPAGAATLGSIFSGTPANGTWNLFIDDDTGADAGSISGVCLDIGYLP
jgi:hypothetical protein